MSDHVEVRVEGGVMILTMARPEKKNALTGAMYQALTGSLTRAAADDAIRVVLLQGSGGDFTAGNDITDFRAVNAAGDAPRAQHAQAFLRALAQFDKPMVAAVEGVAVGIGLTLLLHCDLVVVAEDARLAAPFGLLGLTPEGGSSLLLTERNGHVRAFSVFTLGQAVTGMEAAQWGLANRAVAAADVSPTARALAETLATRSPAALSATKVLMRRPNVLERIERELVEFEARLRSPEAAAAFETFLKRSAR